MPTRARVKPIKTTRDVHSVRVTHDQDVANELLSAGWVLLHGGVSHLDNHGLNVKPVFVLGEP